MNISAYSDNKTANTNIFSAQQRAENLYVLGCKTVLELCVGPSLQRLEKEYAKFNIDCSGNDIDLRWQEYYPAGKWIMGDALNLNIDLSSYDAIVFAPPLSKSCSGRREDSLSLELVTPSYNSFINAYKDFKGIKVMVLPGRTLSIKHDRTELHKLLNHIDNYELVPLKNKVTKYLDIYFY